MFPTLLNSPNQVFVKLTSVKWKRMGGWKTFNIYQNTGRLVTVSRVKNALDTVDYVM